MPRKKKQCEQSSNTCQFDIDAVMQEANRLFFHQIGLELLYSEDGLCIVKPNEPSFLILGSNVDEEMKNASTVIKMKAIARKERGIIGAQPIVPARKA